MPPTDDDENTSSSSIPIIDLSAPPEITIPQIADACSTWGVFQVINYNHKKQQFSPEIITSMRREAKLFFDLPHFPAKSKLYRYATNARGFLDHELTKQRRDWKECLEMGVPGSRDWGIPDADERNACLEGYNKFPTELPNFRQTAVEFFGDCAGFADVVAHLMMKGLLGVVDDDDEIPNEVKVEASSDDGNVVTVDPIDILIQPTETLLQKLRKEHTSFLRINHYPPRPPPIGTPKEPEQPWFGIRPHNKSGFLELLFFNDGSECRTHQVAKPGTLEDWVTVKPVEGSIVVNCGDMTMIWSNGRYRSARHRVLADTEVDEYTTTFVYNPGYQTIVRPLDELLVQKIVEEVVTPKYHPCAWGYFRAVRFAGNLADLGKEIDVKDYEYENKESHHPKTQVGFLERANFHQPFNVSKHREWLLNN